MGGKPGPLACRLALPDNLYWAWRRVKSMYRPGDVWFDEAAVARFEINLMAELDAIARQFSELTYSTSRIEPLPGLKKQPEEDTPAELRQTFWIPVRDQVAWMAFCNVVGPWIDRQMPAWSFGNRLHRSVWRESNGEGRAMWRIGPYRRSGSHFYRKWQQTWPLFRRYILLTIRAMAHHREEAHLYLDSAATSLLESEERRRPEERLRYLWREYWKPGKEIHYGMFDLKAFYPSVSLDCVLDGLSFYSGERYGAEVRKLAGDLLRFTVDYSDWSEEGLDRLGLSDRPEELDGIPTGLFVAGFLSNVALLKADRKVAGETLHRQVAHFRYVDDHVVLARSQASLEEWILWYREQLAECRTGADLNPEKTSPEQLRVRLENALGSRDNAPVQPNATGTTQLDPRFPEPLLTQTMQLVSRLAATPFELLTEGHQEQVLGELEYLLTARIPDVEMRADTRLAFAAGMLSRLSSRLHAHLHKRADALGRQSAIQEQFEARSDLGGRPGEGPGAPAGASAEDQRQLFVQADANFTAARDEAGKRFQRIFWLLLKAAAEHPEKLRLWLRILEFSRKTGYGRLERVFETISRVANRDSLAGSYLRAIVLQLLARQILMASWTLNAPEHPPELRRAALHFLISSSQTSPRFIAEEPKRRYEKASTDLFRCAVGTARLLLSHASEDALLGTEEIPSAAVAVGHLADDIGAIDWSSASRTWQTGATHSLAIWAWWAEATGTYREGMEPSPVWHAAHDLLDFSDACSLPLLQRFPDALSTAELKQIAKSQELSSRVSEGWLFDAMHSRDALRGIPTAKRSDKAACVAMHMRRIRAQRRHQSLGSWCEWTAKRFEEPGGEFDPRVGEWTAVRIIRDLADNMRSLYASKHFADPRVHPSNFLIPTTWCSPEEGGVLTWEAWRETIRQHPPKCVENGVFDSRFTPGLGQFESPVVARVGGMAMLLLGLLRRDFTLPGVLNTVGQERAWPAVVRRQLRTLRCSSMTLAVLEGALFLPRARENLYLQFLDLAELRGEFVPADDTDYDPPFVRNLANLVSCLDRALEELKCHQITVHQHRPRQLIPASAPLLARQIWSSSDTGSDGDGNG